MLNSAITLTLYDKNDQPRKEYSRAIIPWGLLKKASRLMDAFAKADENSEEVEVKPKKKWFFQKEILELSTEEKQMDAISQFVVELFGNQFTLQELEDGADMGEIMTVFQSVLTRANTAVQANPTMLQLPLIRTRKSRKRK